MQTLMFPSILRLASCRRSSSSGARGPSRCSNASVALERFSNSARHLFRSSKRKVQGLLGGSRFGASSESLLHNCAYIELYLGSSRAFSKICNTKRTYKCLSTETESSTVPDSRHRKESMTQAATLPHLFHFKTMHELSHDSLTMKITINILNPCEISSSHGGEYEAQNLLACTAVFLIECRPTFQMYVLPPSSGSTYL